MGRLLITVQSGLVGTQFQGDLIALSSKVCDIGNPKAIDYVFSFYTDKERQGLFDVDKVMHCVAKVDGIGKTYRWIERQVKIN